MSSLRIKYKHCGNGCSPLILPHSSSFVRSYQLCGLTLSRLLPLLPGMQDSPARILFGKHETALSYQGARAIAPMNQ